VIDKVQKPSNSDVDSVVVLLHHVDEGNIADVYEVHAASIFRLKVSKLSQHTSKLLATLPISKECNNSKTESTQTVNHCKT
jgi:hypothetical protein